MAKWKLTYEALEFIGRDGAGWPIIDLISDSYNVEDNSIRRVSVNAKNIVLNTLPKNIVGVRVFDIERIDEMTGKNYFESYQIEDLNFELEESDAKKLRKIQFDLLSIDGGSLDFDYLRLFNPDLFVMNLMDVKAFFVDGYGVLSHEEGALVLENLNNFYNSFTSDQINVLRINPKSVSYDENKLIRRFLGQDRQVVDSSSKQNYVKNGSKVNLKFLEEKIKDSEIISDIIDWIVENEENPELLKNFSKLTPENLSKLNTLSGIVTLKNCLLRWEENLLHSSEDFWQKEFEDNSYVISQLFTSPVTIMKSKAYLGGKSIHNTGGSLVDYLFVNKLTKNTSIIELKTPATRLLGSNYRSTIYNISAELSGAIVQLSNYKDELLKNYYQLANLNKGIFHAYDPSCILIVGNFATELDSEEKVKSFELFRQQLQNIQIITFDELFEKMRLLIHSLEGS
ncbi:Shedu immune nuclease family protein [Leptospira mayottensis]|uniref:PF14082 domain protein n=2 Tax=Leptospira mayottensis TaxID=1137606 RepID=A0AA87MJ69_9LEPT|nr:Shedu immune nuclease family protein [Leptospira mayottensis]AXR66612.1 DUF4263 domain-containing protein [Leptospira mayottensis]AZQ04253.1 DUF4263 domain-containing protein [Leptospira mayottensis 200901116]EKR98085.1 PF14082 domain protein [Leptospira mayottensis 200901122]TGN04346.1 DUF4263 domain-containing protein [Leptospira mayottensis]